MSLTLIYYLKYIFYSTIYKKKKLATLQVSISYFIDFCLLSICFAFLGMSCSKPRQTDFLAGLLSHVYIFKQVDDIFAINPTELIINVINSH